MTSQKRRLNERIAITEPFRILGTDIMGEPFVEDGKTIAISRHGATVPLKAKVAALQKVTIVCRSTRKEASARVVGMIGGKSDTSIYAVAIVNSDVTPWSTKFPPLLESEIPVTEVMLKCAVCMGHLVIVLDELEAEVLEANQSITRYCSNCGASTSWTQASDEPANVKFPSDHARVLRTLNRRKSVRISLKWDACIRLAGFGEEVVVTENVSRYGVCIKSNFRYLEGSRVEVALPYSPGGVNVFLTGRILVFEELSGGPLSRYRIAYIS
jgi:hypothetical protein